MNHSHMITMALCACLFCAGVKAAENRTKMAIGDVEVEATNTGGKVAGDRWIVVSNSLIRVHAEVAPQQGPPQMTNGSRTNSGPLLRLLLNTGNGKTAKFGAAKGLHGLMYMAGGWQTPTIAQTNRVDILSSEDKTRIVVMVLDDGPIYSSTNSGLTWEVTSAPGKYDFPLTIGPNGEGFTASATLHPSQKKTAPDNFPATNWYAIGKGPKGSELVIIGNPSQPAPVLSIASTGAGAVVSWPAQFPNYILQANSDLTSTNWVDLTNSVTKTETEYQVFIFTPADRNFYRLKSP